MLTNTFQSCRRFSQSAMPVRPSPTQQQQPSSVSIGKKPMAYQQPRSARAASKAPVAYAQPTPSQAQAQPQAPVPPAPGAGHRHPSPPSSNASVPQKPKGKASANKIWSTSTTEERERIKDFWLGLGEEERRNLVKIEKDTVLRKMKEQQKHSCSCAVCGRKRFVSIFFSYHFFFALYISATHAGWLESSLYSHFLSFAKRTRYLFILTISFDFFSIFYNSRSILRASGLSLDQNKHHMHISKNLKNKTFKKKSNSTSSEML